MSKSKTKKYKANLPPWMIDLIFEEDKELARYEEQTLQLPLYPYIEYDMPISSNPSQKHEIVDYVIRNDILGDT
jgi:hypothetical protein